MAKKQHTYTHVHANTFLILPQAYPFPLSSGPYLASHLLSCDGHQYHPGRLRHHHPWTMDPAALLRVRRLPLHPAHRLPRMREVHSRHDTPWFRTSCMGRQDSDSRPRGCNFRHRLRLWNRSCCVLIGCDVRRRSGTRQWPHTLEH